MNYKDFYRNILLENILEGVDDPGSFKAVILLGGAGSGKTYAASKMFGVPRGLSFSTGGLKAVNSDTPFELLLRRNNIDLDLSKLPADQKDAVVGTGPDSLRSKAQRVRDIQYDRYSEEGTGILLDSTGEWKDHIQERVRDLQSKGYDVTIVFVDTPLETAMERNRARERRLPDHVVERMHSVVRRNVAELQEELGDLGVEFTTVQNGDGADIEEMMRTELGQVVRRAVDSPIQNPEGRRRIVQRRGGAVTRSSQRRLGRTRGAPRTKEEQRTRYKEILQTRIKNPETGRMVLVASALSAPKDSRVHQLARTFIKQQMQRK